MPSYAHSLDRIWEREVLEATVRGVLEAPQQRYSTRAGKAVFQSLLPKEPAGRLYLLRVFVDTTLDPPEIVSVYWTSQIERYWRGSR